MLNIDEKQLKLLLERKKKFIERPKLSGLGEIISGISLIDKAGNICYNYHESIIEYAWGSDTRGKRSLRGGYGRLVLTWRCDLGKEESPMGNNFNGLSCVNITIYIEII